MTAGDAGPTDQPVVILADIARVERARALVRRMLIAIPVIALVVVVVVALLQPRLSLVILTAVFVAVLALVLVQALRRRRAVDRAADAAGVAFALDDGGVYIASLATTIGWHELRGIVHWDQSERVRRATSRGVWGVGPRFVADTGGHSHHLTFGVHDGAALRERVAREATSTLRVGRKAAGGTVVVLPDVALSPESTAVLLAQLRLRAEARGIPFSTVTNAFDWAAAGATLELAS